MRNTERSGVCNRRMPGSTIGAMLIATSITWLPLASARDGQSSSVAAFEKRLQNQLDDVIRQRPQPPGIMLRIEAPRLGLNWEGAAGAADKATHEKLTPRYAVRIASITKTFLAIATLRLCETGRLNLDQPIASLLSDASREMLLKGGYDTVHITIRHLLAHTSGLFDFAMSTPFDQAVRTNPSRRWQRPELLRGAMEWGKPYGAPGSVFAYSDTGYIVLGEILENVVAAPLPSAIRETVGYEPIGLTSTWFETLEPTPSGVQRAHQYLDGEDTYAWDPSMDLYGGGGLVSTLDDLTRLFRALFDGRIFANPETLRTFVAPTIAAGRVEGIHAKRGAPIGYGLGIAVESVDGMTVYQHGGYWGTIISYVPQLDLTVAVAITEQTWPGRDELIPNLIRQVRALEVAQPHPSPSIRRHPSSQEQSQ